MDRFVQNLSLRLAEKESRRGFLGGIVRGAVALGMGAVALMAGKQPAFAKGNCTNVGKSKGACTGNPCEDDPQPACHAGTVCSVSDTRPLCKDLKPAEPCGSKLTEPCPNGRTMVGVWTCCCTVGMDRIKKHCFLCRKGDTTNICKCPFDAGAC